MAQNVIAKKVNSIHTKPASQSLPGSSEFPGPFRSATQTSSHFHHATPRHATPLRSTPLHSAPLHSTTRSSETPRMTFTVGSAGSGGAAAFYGTVAIGASGGRKPLTSYGGWNPPTAWPGHLGSGPNMSQLVNMSLFKGAKGGFFTSFHIFSPAWIFRAPQIPCFFFFKFCMSLILVQRPLAPPFFPVPADGRPQTLTVDAVQVWRVRGAPSR